MSIGRIEIVNGKKQYVRYATLGGGKTEPVGVPLGNVKDLTLEESTDHLTLTWKDPEDVVFNGETIAEWAGTKVVRKEGISPESAEDGTLIADSKVRDQYSVEGLQDTNVVAGTQYNYMLFPYTEKNVYTMSDANRASGKALEYYPTLADNTWDTINEISAKGKAAEVWNIGDKKDNYRILAFDHNDLVSGEKAGITFMTDDITLYPGVYNSTRERVLYEDSTAYKNLQTIYDGLPEELKRNIKETSILVQTSTGDGSTVRAIPAKIFLLSNQETWGSPDWNEGKDGVKYENFGKLAGSEYGWLRTLTYRHTADVYLKGYGWVYHSGGGDLKLVDTTGYYYRWAFCI